MAFFSFFTFRSRLNFEVLKLYCREDRIKYSNILSEFEYDPYELIDYLDVFCDSFDNLICFNYSKNNKDSTILMLVYLRPVTIHETETPYFDVISPYGYSGPVFSDKCTDIDIRNFWKEVDNWYREKMVISEFIRFKLAGNHYLYSGELFPSMLNIKGKILDSEKQWELFDRKVRKNFRKATKQNLSCKILFENIYEKDIKNFYEIYISTMKRTNATDFFFYNMQQFKAFILNNKNHCLLGTVFVNEKAISTELVLLSKSTMYSFLGGTNEKYFDKRPNDYLKVELINWGRQNNKNFYVLGGGYGLEDGIFKYKKSFFPNDVVQFNTGRKIINKEIYKSLIDISNENREKRGMKLLEPSDTSFFPLYRKLN